MSERQPDGIHTIPVPRGMSVEQAWENIARGASLLDPQPSWANVIVKDGRLVKVLPAEAPAEVDLLAALNALHEQIAACKRHPRTSDPAYEKVWLGLCDASYAILDALNGWPA